MFNICFRTDLDEPKSFVEHLGRAWQGGIPSIGHRVSFTANNGALFELEVRNITWRTCGSTVVVDLGPCREQAHMTTRDWSAWFLRHMRGGRPSSPGIPTQLPLQQRPTSADTPQSKAPPRMTLLGLGEKEKY